MPHVTFIHGIGNKTSADELLDGWRGSLAGHGLDLTAVGATSSMIYWADLLYPSPGRAEVAYESAGRTEDPSVPDIGMRWAVEAEGEEARFIEGLASAIGFAEFATDEPLEVAPPVERGAAPVDATGFERIPLPGWLKRRLMKILLRDVHHYLFDAEFSPRPGETYRIQRTIRKRVVDALEAGAQADGPHVVVSHSMGTVIIYDCLKRVDGCPPVDGLMTIGSPLGLDDIQDGLKPEWTRSDGFPPKCGGHWVNVFDRLDPVAALDAGLANDYQRRGSPVIDDLHESNWGTWRHDIAKYFAGTNLRARLESLLTASADGP
ncbi:MAG TPA: hypothetical protein VFZ70_01700 [Euzebyales bacterium]